MLSAADFPSYLAFVIFVQYLKVLNYHVSISFFPPKFGNGSTGPIKLKDSYRQHMETGAR